MGIMEVLAQAFGADTDHRRPRGHIAQMAARAADSATDRTTDPSAGPDVGGNGLAARAVRRAQGVDKRRRQAGEGLLARLNSQLLG